MADNITVDNGALADYTVADDEVQVAGTQPLAHVQFMKLVDGTLNGTDPISGTAANGLDVDVTRVQGSVAVTGPLTDAQLRAVAVPISAAALPLPAGAATAALQLADGHNVTVDNAAGVAAVNIQDGGNVITVDGTVSVTEPVTVDATDLDIRNLAHTQDSVRIGDGTDLALVSAAGALLVDASATTQPVSNAGLTELAGAINASAQMDTNIAAQAVNLTVVGAAANASPVSGNPVLIAGRASTAIPTDVGADGDAASLWLTRNGAQVVTMAPHVGIFASQPWNLTSETAQYTTTQTSAVLVAGGVSERIVVTAVQIQVGGTTAGTLQIYFGTGAYSRGTSLAIFDGEFAPSATLKPGVVMQGPFISAANGDDILVTTSAAIDPLTITVWYYVVV